MRVLFLCTQFLFFLGSCGQPKTIIQNGTTYNQQNITTIQYDAFSRGYFLAVSIDKDQIKKFKDRNLKEFDTKNCTEKDWNKVLLLINDIELKKINTLQAPSDKRTFDGAAHARLKIISGDKIYTSAGFDHGNPPEDLKVLVNTILSLTESIE
ncbi:hypothetical protein [Aquimarina sp. 2201CG14-23]|uniref:hypothetical protein n=1 Tax=Aquimarina mycalae TaxID=3040073 RepID=UPI002477FD69|nr:hypothetical protein [Aquimarina sp. 2201CG14-23]MDH7446284.1 hypothetical protein [Aquimarina sp. 2201CG14-23]